MQERTLVKRIIVAYSGGLETSLAIRELSRHPETEVITVTVDVGQGDDLADIRERALSLGAVRAHVIDARDELIRSFIVPSLHAGALQDGVYPLSPHMTSALIAGRLVSIARMENASTIVHGSTRHPDRLEVPMRALDSALELATAQQFVPEAVSASAAGWARDLGISVGDRWSDRVDVNLWGRSIDVGPVPNAGGRLPDEMFALTRAISESPDEPAYVDIEFAGGTPVKINGIDMPLLEIIESLETIAGSHAVGRLERIVVSDDGVASVEIHEAPSAVVLHAAHEVLEGCLIERELGQRKQALSRRYAELVASGGWFDQARAEMDAFVAGVQSGVTGVVRAKLFKGECTVVGGQSTASTDDERRRRATVG